MAIVFKSNDEIVKFNPYHDRLGRFTTAGSAASFTIRTKNPLMQSAADKAIGREKERTAAEENPAQRRKQAIKAVEDKIRHQNFESAAIIGKDGKQLLFKDGEKSEVSFSAKESALMRGATLTHNHPNGSNFSYQDVRTFVRADLAEIRATNREGKTYVLRRSNTDDLNSYDYEKRSKEYKFIENYQKNYNKSVKKAQAELDAKGYGEKVRNGEMTQDQANKDFRKAISAGLGKYLSRYAKNYGFEYEVEGE